jgi:gluconolactonase
MTFTPTHYRRREFMSLAATGVVSSCLPRSCSAGIKSEYAALETDRYLGPVEVLAKVTDAEVFTEGPAVDRAGLVHFTNVPVSKILQWDPATETLSVFQEETQKTNGLCFDRQGRLLACEGGAGRVTRTDLRTGHKEVLADQFEGKKLAAPNDLCIDSVDRIYFTSRSGTQDPVGENKKSVYRIDPNGALSQVLVWPTVHMPNGIVISPDDSTLYLIEAHPDAEHHRDIRAFDLLPDGSLKNGRILVNFYPGRSGDGMAIDAEGNLYVAAGLHKLRGTSETLETQPGIHVVSPAGKLLGFRQTPEDTITNCTFGGPDLKTLYVTCGTLLLGIPSVLPGKAI